MGDDVVYFELNNWFAGRDYPDAEPFLTWMQDSKLDTYIRNDGWVRKNKLCVVSSFVDMSCNFCITAKRSWVEDNIPMLLTDDTYEYKVCKGDTVVTESKPFKLFLRTPEDGEDTPVGRFGYPFLEYTEENIGVKWWDEVNHCWKKVDKD